MEQVPAADRDVREKRVQCITDAITKLAGSAGLVAGLENTLAGIVELSVKLRTFLKEKFSGDSVDRASADATAVPAEYLIDEDEDPVVRARRRAAQAARVKATAKKQADLAK